MTVLDLRGADIAIRGAVGTDLEVSITFTDSAGDAVDISGYTVAADVIRDVSTVVDSFASAVSGAGSNVLTLTLTDTETAAIGTEQGLKWRLNMTASGSTEQWLAGEFRLFAAGHPKAGTGASSLSVQVSGAITATVQTPLPLATLDGRYVLQSGAAPSIIVPPAVATVSPAWTPATHQLANRGFGMAFSVLVPRSYRYVNLYIGTASGNIEVAILRRVSGTEDQYTSVVSTGVIACPTAGAKRIDLGATELAVGDYWIGVWADNTTVTFPRADLGSGGTHMKWLARLNSNASGFGSSGTWDTAQGAWAIPVSLEASDFPT